MSLPLENITKIKLIKEFYLIDLKVSAYKLNISKYKRNWPEWISGSHDLGNINTDMSDFYCT